MNDDRLKVNYVEKKTFSPASRPLKTDRRVEVQARMEAMWHNNPRQFDPERDCMQKHRITLTLDAIRSNIAGGLAGKRVADLGCGSGAISHALSKEGAIVDALDIAGNALSQLEAGSMERIRPIQDCLPHTRLEDNSYDIVVCTDLIAYLDPKEYRLLMAEISRIVKPDGIVVVSTGFDVDTEDPLEGFASLGETEFIIDSWIFNYHKLFVKLLRIFDAPGKSEVYLGRGIAFITNPIANFIRQNTPLMHFLDRISRLLWSEDGISDALFIGKRRPLTFPLPENEIPREIKHKRQVWE